MESIWKRVGRKTLVIIFAPIWIPFLITDRYREPIELWLGRTLGFGFEIGTVIREIWRAFVYLCHLSGWILTVALLFLSSLMFVYIAAKEFSYEILWLTPYYPHLEAIIRNPVSWATATTVIATTVAIGHVWNLELNRKRYMEEQKEKWKREYEERRKNNAESIQQNFPRY